MKTKSTPAPRKQNVAVKDLKTRKNPTGGAPIVVHRTNKGGKKHGLAEADHAMGEVSTMR